IPQLLAQRALGEACHRARKPAVQARMTELPHGAGEVQVFEQGGNHPAHLVVAIRSDVVKIVHAVPTPGGPGFGSAHSMSLPGAWQNRSGRLAQSSSSSKPPNSSRQAAKAACMRHVLACCPR